MKRIQIIRIQIILDSDYADPGRFYRTQIRRIQIIRIRVRRLGILDRDAGRKFCDKGMTTWRKNWVLVWVWNRVTDFVGFWTRRDPNPIPNMDAPQP